MANWIIRATAPSVTVERDRVVLKSRRRISIAAGDALLLLSRELTFSAKARVLEVREGTGRSLLSSAEGEEKNWWEIDIDGWKELPLQLKLDEASTSLTFVQNWRRPNVHVRLSYRRLPDEDMKTLDRGELFVARDAYLTLLDALPERLFQSFLAENPRLPRTWRSVAYADRARALIEFIEKRVMSIGRVASTTQRFWDNLCERTGSTDTHTLYVWNESDDIAPIDFTAQVDAFHALQRDSGEGEQFSGSQLTEIGEIMGARQSTELRFENLFRNRIDE